jgi:signal transduction histidine kinase
LTGIADGLKAEYQGSVQVVAETVGPVPPEPEGFSTKIVDWLAYKYGRQTFDVVVALNSPAVPAAESIRDRLWPDAPLLLVLQEEDRSQFPQFVRRSARVVVGLSNTETLRSALQMLPSTQHLAFLEGASVADRRENAEILATIRRNHPKLDIIEIAGLSWEDTKARVRSLPDHSIVLVGSFFFDKNGRQLISTQQVEELLVTANAPIFTDNDVNIGKGAVGGSVLSIRPAGVVTGIQVAKLLSGVDPGNLPDANVGNSFIADWRMLKRWGISERTLPADATILYRPPSAWEQYKQYILGAIVLILLLLGLVLFLLVERGRRKKEEELNSAMLDSLPGLAVLVDTDGRILRTNRTNARPEHLDLASASELEPGTQYLRYLRRLTRDTDRAGAAIEQVIAGRCSSADAELKESHGNRWIEVQATQLPQVRSGTLIVHFDITPRKQAELERNQSQAEIYHLNRVAAMGQLSASLAHELAQPLSAIMSNAEAAQRFANRPIPDMLEIREALDDIKRDDSRARAVIQNMRAMLKKEHIVIAPIDLNEVAGSVMQMIWNEAALRGVTFELALSSTPVIVSGDRIALQQVVLNLASNGLDAMMNVAGQRCLTICTTIQPEAKLGTLWVQDSGPGIPVETRDKLFEPFFTTKKTGLGMGLSICRSILESLNGNISVKEHSGQGAAFFLELPLADQVTVPVVIERHA